MSYGAVMKAVDWVRALHLLEQLQVRVVLGTVFTHQSHRYPRCELPSYQGGGVAAQWYDLCGGG